MKKHAKVALTETAKLRDPDSDKYKAYKNAPVSLQSATSFTRKLTTVKKVKASSSGKVKISVKMDRPTCFRFQVAGTSTAVDQVGPTACVDLK